MVQLKELITLEGSEGRRAENEPDSVIDFKYTSHYMRQIKPKTGHVLISLTWKGVYRLTSI